MKIRHYLLQKPSILIWVSVLSGFFVTSEEIMDCIELSRIRGIDPEIDSILLLIFQCLFFILFTRILLQINVCWQPEGKGHLKQFAYSSLVSVLFSLIVWLGVSPVIRSTNQISGRNTSETNRKKTTVSMGRSFSTCSTSQRRHGTTTFSRYSLEYTRSAGFISSPHVKRKWSETTRN